MFDHDHAVTIAGLRAERDSLIVSLRAAIDDGSTSEERLMRMIAEAELACVTAERDALAAQLAEVRAKLDAAPKVCAIHSYEHGPGPCMTCGAWPPGTRELIAACQTRIAGLEQAANERSAEVARLTARPVFAGVSEEELALEYARAVDRIPGIRAVLARLEVSLVAPVDPEVVARQALRPLAVTMRSDEVKRSVENVRATLTAAGIPVTPEVGK